MRRSASEIIRNLEMRVARLEKQSGLSSPLFVNGTLSIEEAYKTFKVRAIKMVNSLDKYMSRAIPHMKDLQGLKEPLISERYLRGVFDDIHQTYASDKSVVQETVFMRIFSLYTDSISYHFKSYQIKKMVSSFLQKYLGR